MCSAHCAQHCSDNSLNRIAFVGPVASNSWKIVIIVDHGNREVGGSSRFGETDLTP